MKNWFTIEAIDPTTFAISEYNHWEQVHSYLLIGKERAALIDTGLGVANIREEVEKLTDLPILVLTTHVHWDHIGGHRYFNNIAVHKNDRRWLSDEFPLSLDEVKRHLTQQAFEFPVGFQLDQYQVPVIKPSQLLVDGDVIDLGDRVIQVFHTPGHSPGHCCFYEPVKEYLYSGDLLYKGELHAFYPSTDPQLFKKSVEQMAQLSLTRILPGHYELTITPALIQDAVASFKYLANTGKLKHGTGRHDFGSLKIRL